MQDARRFIDRFGFQWQVCELWSSAPAEQPVELADMPPRSDGWLYFFSRGTTLVFREYPEGWADLSWVDFERWRESARVLGSDTTIRIPGREARDARVGKIAHEEAGMR